MSEAPFSLRRHELPATGGQPSLIAEPLRAEQAGPLGEAFAAIDPWASYPYPAAGLVQYLGATEPGAPRFALYLAGELAGAVGLRLNWLRGSYLQFLGLLPSFQRRGVGERVLTWIENEARGANERNLWVAASDFNSGAIRFYERHGFAVAAELADLVRDGRTEVLMRKRL
jgi:ribosomal protein S18 acetylase RimI-like enzyme